MKVLLKINFQLLVTACLFLAVMLVANTAFAGGFWEDIQKKGELRIGAATSPPFTSKDPKTGEYGGPYFELPKLFAKELGVKPVFVDTTWDNLVAGLQAGKWDIAPSMNRRIKRALVINYSTHAGYTTLDLVFDPKNPKMKGFTSDIAVIDKKGVKIAVLSGSAQDHAATKRFTKAKIVRLPGGDEARMALLSRRADALLDDVDSNRNFLLANKGKYVAVEPSPAFFKQGIAFGFRKDVPWEAIEVFNIFLEEKRNTGAVDEMMLLSSKKMIDSAK